MPTNQQYSSTAVQTNLTGAITNTATSVNVASTTGFPTAFPFTVAFDVGLLTQELVDVTNVVGLTLTVTRGVDSSTGQAHANAATVTHVYIGRDAREARAHIDAVGGNDSTGKAVHGLVGNVVGTTDAQTLTNKTLTSPTVNGGTFSGATFNDLVTNESAAGTIALKSTGVLNGTGDLFQCSANGVLVFRVQQNGAAGAGHVLIAPNDNSGTPGLTINTPTGVGPFAFQINSVDQWKANGAGNLASAGTTNALDLTTMTGAKPVIGPQLLAFTPTLSGTGLSLGNGTLSGGYVQYGKQVFVEMYLIVGSTTNLGTTAISMALPLAAFNYAELDGFLTHAGTTYFSRGINTTAGSSTIQPSTISSITGGAAVLSQFAQTVPWTWAAGDIIYLKGTYQATS